ncbi:unnamed protein product [Adineta steineri]|uniref:Metalloprotease TIKI homolog n=1 Tax=Adineta steineri TaxID=433720 RepID=A0A814LWR5_9BILA|nr:unnamed protein product [Adineta steineri]CAF1322455.1 unnamed protein product [Adineta steineri]
MPNIILGLVLFIIFSTCSSTLLWRIETTPPSYIFGTIHIPYNLVWPHISNKTREAFFSSTHFYAEIDAKDDMYWDDFYQCLLNRSIRTRRTNLLITQEDLLDIHLAVEARRLNKTVGSLEPAEYHCMKEGWRYNLTTWYLILNLVKKEMKNRTYSIIDANDYFQDLTIKKYICGEMNREYIQTLFKSADEIQQMEHRDEQISNHIHTLLDPPNNNRYFFGIGAAHMLGKYKNILVRLKTFGYKITRLCTNRKGISKKFGCKNNGIMKHCITRKSLLNKIS